MPLTKALIKRLTEQAHALNPVIIIGQKGFTPEAQAETDLALSHHELIKIRINAPDKQIRKTIADNICQQLACALITEIGHVIVVYRAK